MKEFYLIIKTGCEGIERIAYPAETAKEAVRKFKETREKDYQKERAFEKKMMKECKEKGRLYHTRQRVYDYWCIMKWDGKNFECVCNQLGVSPSQIMLR